MKLLITCEIVVLIFSITKVTAQKGPGRVIVHPGQDVELLCTVIENSPARTEGWLVNNAGPYGINALRNGILSKHSASLDGGNLMVENITKNDGRNGSEYICVIVPAEGDTITIGDIINQSDPTFLYVTGVPTMIPNVMHMVDINTYENNVTLTLSWGEPFNNFDPIVNYTVSCSGDVTCPPNYTTTDNTTRSYTITNLTPMTNYIFSVVATNSIGSGEATAIVINTPAINTPAIIPPTLDTSVTDAVIVLSTPNATNELHSITVTCTIHPDSTADQCVVMAMADGRMTITGTAPVVNGMATVTVNGLQCEVTYTIIAGGTLNGDLVGPRSSHGAVTAGPCPVCPVAYSCEACDSNDNGVIIGAVVGAFCVVIIIMVITNIMVWIYCFRKRHHTGTSLELHGPTKDTINPAYHTITDDHSKREPVSYYEDVNRPPEVKMTPNPAYSAP